MGEGVGRPFKFMTDRGDRQVLGFESGRGLGDYLQDGCDVADLIVWPGIEKLTVLLFIR